MNICALTVQTQFLEKGLDYSEDHTHQNTAVRLSDKKECWINLNSYLFLAFSNFYQITVEFSYNMYNISVQPEKIIDFTVEVSIF